MKNQITKSLASKIEAIRLALNGVKEDLITAGKLVVEMLEENEDAFEILLRERIARLSMLEALEQIGRGKLDPMLLADPSYIAQRAVRQGIPMGQQRQIQNEHIAVAAISDDGEGIEIKHKTKDEISLAESIRVIRDGKIATPEEQVAVLKEQQARATLRRMTYRVDPANHTVTFMRDTEWNYSQLAEIVEKIKPDARDIEATIIKRQIAK